MKKTLSLLLIVAMLLSACLSFVACGVSAKDVEADPQAAVNDAMKTATEDFFEDNSDLIKIIEEALKSGSMSLHIENGGDSRTLKTVLDETVYFDQANKRVVSDSSLTIGEDALSARLFLDKNGLALHSESLFGTEDTYALSLASLEENVGQKEIVQSLLGIETSEDLAVTSVTINRLKTLYDALFAETAEEDIAELTNEIYKVLNHTVTTETLETADGKSVKCLVSTLTLNNESYTALLNLFLTKLKLTKADIDALSLSHKEKFILKQMIEGIGEDIIEGDTGINITQRVYMNKKSGALVKNEIDGTVTEDNETGTVKMSLEFAEDRILLDADVDVEDTKLDFDVTLTKEKEKKNVIYKLEVNGGDGKGATVNFLNATLTYAKNDETFDLAADLYQVGKSRLAVTASGTVSVTKEEAKIELNSYTEKGKAEDLKFSVCFKTSDTAPARPSEVTELFAMRKKEWQDFLKNVQESRIASLILGMVA